MMDVTGEHTGDRLEELKNETIAGIIEFIKNEPLLPHEKKLSWEGNIKFLSEN